MIFHIIASFLPADSVTLATCVQNKAVDAIADKLAMCQGRVPFIVFGNEARLGPVAQRWTINAQARTTSPIGLWWLAAAAQHSLYSRRRPVKNPAAAVIPSAHAVPAGAPLSTSSLRWSVIRLSSRS